MSRRFALLLLTCTASLGLAQTGAGSAVGAVAPLAIATAAPPTSPSRQKLLQNWVVAQAASDRPSILKLGSQGSSVQNLQTRLRQLGYYSDAIDGAYGESTQAAVSKFQQAIGLGVDGRVGTETWQQLRRAKSEPVPEEPVPEAPIPEAQTSSQIFANAEPSLNQIAAPEPTAKQNWRRWVLLVLSILGGVAVLRYILIRLKSNAVSPASVSSAEAMTTEAMTTEAMTTEAMTAASPSFDRQIKTQTETANATEIENSNGFLIPQSSSEAIDPVKAVDLAIDRDTATISAALPVQETTRLAKINIREELVHDLHSLDPVQRRKAIWELGQRGDSQAVQPLVDLMMDSDSNQRSLILAAISEIGVRTLKPMSRALIISLQDENSDVRKNAIRDLTRIYDQVAQISQLLGHAVNDSDAEVQETARWALGQLNRIRTIAGADSTVLTNTPAQDYLPGEED